jgi:hypothetical protein
VESLKTKNSSAVKNENHSRKNDSGSFVSVKMNKNIFSQKFQSNPSYFGAQNDADISGAFGDVSYKNMDAIEEFEA